MSRIPPMFGRSKRQIKNKSLFLGLHKMSPCVGSTSWVHKLAPQDESMCWVHELGPQVGSSSWVNKLGGGGGHYGLWHPANKMTKITNFACSGPIGLKIGQRCGFLPEITHTKFQLSSLNGSKVINMCIYSLMLKTDKGFVLFNFYCFTTSIYVQIPGW